MWAWWTKAVDEGGDHGVAEDLTPRPRSRVAGYYERAVFVGAGDRPEQEVRGLALEREVTVADEQVLAFQPPEFVVDAVDVLADFEAGRPIVRCWRTGRGAAIIRPESPPLDER
jgi:hypothetical protein